MWFFGRRYRVYNTTTRESRRVYLRQMYQWSGKTVSVWWSERHYKFIVKKKMIMTQTEQRPTEDERIAYECGYRRCCQDHDIPYIETRRPLAYKRIIAFNIEITERDADYIFPDRADELAKYITNKLKDGYEKFKRGEPLD